MDAETGPMYAPLLAGYDLAVRERIGTALAVDSATIAATIIAVDGDDAIGHAALRPFGDALEVKKVFVVPERRGEGLSKALMLELEVIARERGVGELILQTGELQGTAIALYEQLGYERTPAFGAYVGIPFEVCFRKSL
jgi:GNAT superfamily N-acetyltransferase